MPEAYLKAQKRDAEGNYVLGLDYPVVLPVHDERATSEAARKRYYVAKLNEGGEPNLALPRRDLQAAQGARGALRPAELRALRAAPQWWRRRRP